MNEIKPNSHRYKDSMTSEVKTEVKTEVKPEVATPPKLQPVISSGRAHIQKKAGINKLTGNPLSEDAQNVKSYILRDVLLPSFQRMVSDIVTNGIDILLYGETGHTKRSNASRVSYRNYDDRYDRNKTDNRRDYRDSRDNRDRNNTRSNRDSVSLFEDVVVDTRGEGEEILSRMSEYLEAYDVISVADMYELANITTCPHTYNNYGWKSVAGATVERIRDGYVIKMPPVVSLK